MSQMGADESEAMLSEGALIRVIRGLLGYGFPALGSLVSFAADSVVCPTALKD